MAVSLSLAGQKWTYMHYTELTVKCLSVLRWHPAAQRDSQLGAHVALFINLSRGIFRVNWSWESDFANRITVMSLRYYEMGFLPMLKETADVSVPL